MILPFSFLFPQELPLVAEKTVEFPAQGLERLQDVEDGEE